MTEDLRVGNGYDVHAFAPQDDADGGRPLVLGGVTVREHGGLAGHSDADVVAHAVTDALLGAAAAGDMGTTFGVDDPEHTGADSIVLLGRAVADVAGMGWRPVNVDATVVAQTPRLEPHLEGMRAALAGALGLDLGAVSVKATTTDRLGAVGAGEGIACQAVCLVRRI